MRRSPATPIYPRKKTPRKAQPPAAAKNAPAAAEKEKEKESDEHIHQALDLIMETLEALAEERGSEEKIWGSMVKQTIKRVHPGFNESYYGYSSFSDLLTDAESRGLIKLDYDSERGNYLVRPVKD